MTKCDVCGKDAAAPRCHHDNNHIVKYNAQKIIFSCSHCGLRYSQMKAFPNYYFRLHRRIKTTVEQPIPAGPPTYKEKRRPKLKKTVLAVLLIAILFATFFFLYENPNILNWQNLSSQNPNHNELVNYALSLINSDRKNYGLQNVTLSSIDSGQEHADNMLKNGYLSHWDLNGYKPYMRYTLAGGQGAVAENCAWEGQTGSRTSIDVESILKDSEYNMMYNDAAENWGHRDNILDPLHNKVSIGIAYDSNNVYFVEDFENDYISWNQLSANGYQVTMQLIIQTQTSNIQQIEIFYDNPSPLTVNQLSNPPYQDGYDPGTDAASVLPPNWQSTSGITITANNWNQNGNSYQISFSLTQAITVYGKGVYTLYLITGTGNSTADSLITYSVWIN